MQSTVYMLPEKSNGQMMSFIIQSKEGDLAVIDGGWRGDAPYLLESLIRLGGPNPVIKLWLLTHPHADHVDALFALTADECPLRIEKIYSRFLDWEFYAAHEYPGDNCARVSRQFAEFSARHPQLCVPFERGQVLSLGSVQFHVLHTPDYSFTREVGNNSGVAFRMDAEGQRFLFLGDLSVEAGQRMLETIDPADLKADFVQMAHHGQGGVDKSFYQAVSPKACLWTTPEWLWTNANGTGPWKTLEVRAWMEELGVKHHFVSKDGDHFFPLPYILDKSAP